MFSARKHGETIESIAERMKSLRVTYPKAGVRDMTDLFWQEHQIKIPRFDEITVIERSIFDNDSRSLVDSYCKTYEPDLVKQRRANCLSRKLFWAAGLFDVVCVDQHDKWREKWKLGLHVGVEPMSGQILWLEIWHTNRNPKIVASYYLDWVEASGCECHYEQHSNANLIPQICHWLLKATLGLRTMESQMLILPCVSGMIQTWLELCHTNG